MAGDPNFEWHISGGGNPRRSGYENLLITVYSHAVFEMRRYRPNTREFFDAADFLEKDPYGVLSDAARERLVDEIWERREAWRIYVSRETFFDENGFYQLFDYTEGEWTNESE